MLKKICTFPLLLLVGLYVFVFEEFVWNPAVRLVKLSRNSQQIRQFEDWVSKRKGNWAIATLILLPGISVWPVKVMSLYLLGHGHPFIGAVTFFVAKVIATALFAQLYTLVGEECEKVKRFHYVAEKIRALRLWAQSSALYQMTVKTLYEFKTQFSSKKNFLKQRFRAVVRFTRKQKRTL